MPTNNYNKTNLDQAFMNGGGGLPAENGPYIGEVMDNHDPTRNGRIRVWLKTRSATDKTDPGNWRTLSYLSPFFGTTPHTMHDRSADEFELNGHSYGMWMTSPDLGVEVLCLFVNGDPNLGYYIGYVPEPQMNHMVPGTGARPTGSVANTSEPMFGNATQLPVVEINKTVPNMRNADFYHATKPVHSILALQLWTQGTITDNVRGPIGSSAQRESPSYAYGINTPGRAIYASGDSLHEGTMKSALEAGTVTANDVKVRARRGGHSFVMDDGDIEGNDQLIRLRTASGHQITMSDDGGTIYLQHANGLTWIELGNEGTVDIFSSNSVNVRTQGEINLHADKNINMYSGKNINMYAKDNIKMECDKNFDIIGKLKTSIYSENKVLVKSDGLISTESAQITSIKAGGNIIEQGALVLMNSGGAASVQKPIYIPPTKLPDTKLVSPTGWQSEPAKLTSIVTRAPTHEPYALHNNGVPNPLVIGAPGTPAPKPSPSKTQDAINTASERPPVSNPVETADVANQANDLGGT